MAARYFGRAKPFRFFQGLQISARYFVRTTNILPLAVFWGSLERYQYHHGSCFFLFVCSFLYLEIGPMRRCWFLIPLFASLLVAVDAHRWAEAAEPCGDCCLFPRSACCSSGRGCKRCNPGTLLQWSYGTSFSGGPDLNEPLVTDRPDFTEAASTVGRGVSQLEMGYTYTYDEENGRTVKSHSYGEFLIRQGILFEWLELRLALNPVDETDTFGELTGSGTEDLYFGFKIGLTPQEGILPEMALIPQMTMPTGSDSLSAEEWLLGLNWVYSWEINDTVSCGGSTQGNRAIDETDQSYTEFAQSFTIGISLLDDLGFYSEWYGLFPHSADVASVEHYYNGGFTLLLNNNIQLDVRAGLGLTRESDDYFVGTGITIRIP